MNGLEHLRRLLGNFAEGLQTHETDHQASQAMADKNNRPVWCVTAEIVQTFDEVLPTQLETSLRSSAVPSRLVAIGHDAGFGNDTGKHVGSFKPVQLALFVEPRPIRIGSQAVDSEDADNYDKISIVSTENTESSVPPYSVSMSTALDFSVG